MTRPASEPPHRQVPSRAGAVPRLPRGSAVLAGLVPLALLAALAPEGPRPWLINESPSLPPGLYVRGPGSDLAPGAVVAVTLPATGRAYLATLGAPADARLLKRVAAAPGERVCALPSRLEVPGRSVPVLARDGLGRPLSRWTGCRRLGPGEVLLLGDTSGSYDGRYFGPVRRETLEGPYRAVLTW
ncbi:S26 family signal peptidase [Brevundimonas staleyi]|uniref:S26 family signal peptidase n=1 Tax=Brevundimonas staleyi TaxID=74326 RepID=A0ABW0FWM6_9CAUL